jgi:hypothetical protein
MRLGREDQANQRRHRREIPALESHLPLAFRAMMGAEGDWSM